jgi:3'(2'), 5'-bisphosphate nucleotidase
MSYQQELLKQTIKIAQEAGKAIMEIYEGAQWEITYKADESPLTQADIVSHHLIVNRLQALTPEIPIVSEEAVETPYEERQTWKTLWLVDPLDGTKEFIKRNGEFTVNIALVNERKPVLGVVSCPTLELTYYGMKQVGAFKQIGFDESTSTQIMTSPYQKGKLKVATSRSHGNEALSRFLASLGENIETIVKGSALKFGLVAEGAAHLYPRFGPTMEWDVAAGHCIVESAGGAVADLHDQPLRYNKADLHNPFFIVNSSPAPWQRFNEMEL